MTTRTLPFFKDIAENDNAWFMRLGGLQALTELKDALNKKADDLKLSADEKDKALLDETKALRDTISTMVDELLVKETDKKVLRYMGIGEE